MINHMQVLAWSVGPMEIGIILVVALLIFGKRLPEVGKSFGKSIVEFKKGLSGIEEDIDDSANNRRYKSRSEPKPTKAIDRTEQADAVELTEKQPEEDKV